jgi:hypothetical protein
MLLLPAGTLTVFLQPLFEGGLDERSLASRFVERR